MEKQTCNVEEQVIQSFKEAELKLAASGTSLPMDGIQIGSAMERQLCPHKDILA